MNVKETNDRAAILVIDDEDSVRKSLAILLRSKDYDVTEASSVSEGIQKLGTGSIDLVITDLRLDGDSGLDVIEHIRRECPSTESILLTAYGSIESAVSAIQAGAFDYITRPFSNREILHKVEKALERRRMHNELMALRQQVAMSYGFDNIVGISKPMIQLKETARRISPTDITILLTGASGTGKELFARAIHHHSERRSSGFIAIDCGAIPENLLESELFGFTKAAFTSAHKDKRGLLEEADGGTIFLDEVSNMPTSIQAKLLRFLQDSVIRPVGSSVSKRVDVRIVAATNRDLGEMVADGEFREDLYYRLNVIPLYLPRLVERAEDIEILTDYFIRKICAVMDRATMSISRSAVDRLLHHTWPGNVRELENTLKRGIALSSDDQLDMDDIIFVTGDRNATAESPPEPHKTLCLKGNLMDSSQRSIIVKALDDNNWNYTRTAVELGIGRTTLWRKIKKYDLSREPVAE